jgi:hypothetical protein
MVEVADLERTLGVADQKLRVLLDRSLMHAENAELADEGVADDLEDVRQDMLAGIRHGIKGLAVRVARFALVERRRVAFAGLGASLASASSSCGMPAPVFAETKRIGIRWPARKAFSNGVCNSSGLGSAPSSR